MKHIKFFENFNEIIEDVIELLDTDNLDNEPQETLEGVQTETSKVLSFVDFMGKE